MRKEPKENLRFSVKVRNFEAMDLALQFPCVYPLIKQGFKRAKSSSYATSPTFEQSFSRTTFNGGDRRIWPQGKTTSSSSSMGRFKKGSICCTNPSDERTSKQEEIISLFKRIQSSISKGKESSGEAEENRDESSENELPLSKAILDVLDKPRKKTQGDTSVKKETTPKLPRPQSSFAKRYIRPSTSGSRGKLPDKALEEMNEKEEKPPLIELQTMKLAELKEVAKNRGIKGYSKLKKSDIINLLESS